MLSSLLGAMVLVRPAAVITGATSFSSTPEARTIFPFRAQSSMTAVPSAPITYHLGRETKLLVPTSTKAVTPFSKAISV